MFEFTSPSCVQTPATVLFVTNIYGTFKILKINRFIYIYIYNLSVLFQGDSY